MTHPRSQRETNQESSSDKRVVKKTGRPVAPTKAETALLPPFQGLTPEHIHLPRTQGECRDAVTEILTAGIGGFDTEAKPTFKKGQKSNGPHVVQFALTDKAFIFQLHRNECEQAVTKLIASKRVLKVGFGLKNDHGQIRNRLGISLNHVLDLDQVFRKLGYRGQIGVRGAVGVLFQQCFKKSKSTTTSNWARTKLSSRQLRYAADDAYAALKIMEELQAAGHLD
ncbi:MAG: 3'-5' exonuclease domain-containing protein 2 [Verrucomicrobiae bacterium]|nr:3'-5' exonuclease domain-containing protein 2 [Verrucomicrobiae bacterium]NNJ86957.1 3'-5' exonuclease domain-containing protein 2 [Akkermansiaceae bacterium]